MNQSVSSKNMMPQAWCPLIGEEFDKPYMQSLKTFLQAQKRDKKHIYPPSKEVFKAFELTAPEQIKCVILGQDPYHGMGQAHGLCFSVKPGVPIPPSLLNIYKELESDVQAKPVSHGCLLAWAAQGVFLLNSVLTVERGVAGSHQGKGWEQFTDRVIAKLNEVLQPIVFVLWGAYAQKKGQIIDAKKHVILKSTHPSPLSAYRGFLGSRPFSQVNQHLLELGHMPIDWQLPKDPGWLE